MGGLWCEELRWGRGATPPYQQHVVQQLQVTIGTLPAIVQGSEPHIRRHFWVESCFLSPEQQVSFRVSGLPNPCSLPTSPPSTSTLQARSMSAMARRLRLAVAMTSSCRQELPAATALAVAMVIPLVIRMKSSGVEVLAGGSGEQKTCWEKRRKTL